MTTEDIFVRELKTIIRAGSICTVRSENPSFCNHSDQKHFIDAHGNVLPGVNVTFKKPSANDIIWPECTFPMRALRLIIPKEETFLGYTNSCRALVLIDGQPQEIWLLIKSGFNCKIIEDRVVLVDKQGNKKTYFTNTIEIIQLLTWQEPPLTNQ